jgi:single-stranded-DNA-specific exonuclease
MRIRSDFFMLASQKRWKQAEYVADEISKWKKELGVSSLVAKLFISRGLKNIDEAKQMLNIEEMEFHDPFLLDGMEEAVFRIEEAVLHGEKIRIYGDYDCDGVSSTTIMIYILKELGANFDYYIPNRFTEGYGLNNGALSRAKDEGVELIITVDTGISAKEQVEFGQSLGLEFIITDHHEPPSELPECIAVINPKKANCSYPFKYLAGAGVAFKLGQALLERIPYEFLDIAALGTIADLVPLQGENRLIAYHGIKALNHTKHVGLVALIDVAGLADQFIDEQRVGFSLGPRINASGRLEDASKAVELLVSDDPEVAEVLALEIDQLNKQRQGTVDEITKEAIDWVEERYPTVKPRVLIVAQKDWNAGVIGIVASRLVEKYYVPTIVLTIDSDKSIAKGSARSIAGFDMYQGLTACKDILPHYGGHPMAAGMTLDAEHIDILRMKMNQLAEQWLTEEDLIPVSSIDIECSIDEITLEAIQELECLAPFGVQNPRPVILIQETKLKECRQVGAEKQHLKCQLEQEGHTLDGIGFGLGTLVSKISMEAKLDLIGQVSINEWNGMKKPQIMIEDVRVTHRQYFDWRGAKAIHQKWDQIDSVIEGSTAVVQCRVDHPIETQFPEGFTVLSFNSEGEIEHIDVPQDSSDIVQEVEKNSQPELFDTFIFYDLPQNMQQLEQICLTLKQGKRFYFIFQHEEEHFFSSIPSREDFKWYYAFLQKRSIFDLRTHAKKLAEHKGWSISTLQFMTKVFLELGFATIENGSIQIEPNSPKKELTKSTIYQQKKEESKLEQELMYSSYSELIQIIENFMQAAKTEEVFVHGF